MITFDAFLSSTTVGATMPADLSPELQALWLCKRERWEDSHIISIARQAAGSMLSCI